MLKTQSQSMKLEWLEKGGKKYLKFLFKDHLSLDAAMATISKWKEELSKESAKTEKVNLIWDCNEMTGYDGAARKTWQATMGELKGQIGDIWIISRNPIFRTAAKTMALLTSYKLKSAKSEDDIG